MRIALIGLPGSGKTTIGKYLARTLHLPFYDLDHVIERHYGTSIKKIFLQRGERYFRTIEWHWLLRLLANDTFVLACGGGTPCALRVWSAFAERKVKVIWLHRPPKQILKTLRTDHRPLFKNKPQSFLFHLLAARRRWYSKAHFVCYDATQVASLFNAVE